MVDLVNTNFQRQAANNVAWCLKFVAARLAYMVLADMSQCSVVLVCGLLRSCRLFLGVSCNLGLISFWMLSSFGLNLMDGPDRLTD